MVNKGNWYFVHNMDPDEDCIRKFGKRQKYRIKKQGKYLLTYFPFYLI